MKDLHGKWVLITGGAGGIGRCMALEFAGKGANIFLADIDEGGMEEAAGRVSAKGVKVIWGRYDVCSADEISALALNAEQESGGIDVLVNNAGIMILSDFCDLCSDDWDRIMGINLVGPIRLIESLLPSMISRGSGHIVNIASMAGLTAVPGASSYTVTKHGLVGLSAALRQELAGKGIGVTAVCPGFVDTPIIWTSELRGFSDDVRKLPDFMLIKPEAAAKEIVRAVIENKAMTIPISPSGRLLYWFQKYVPFGDQMLAKRLYSTFKKGANT